MQNLVANRALNLSGIKIWAYASTLASTLSLVMLAQASPSPLGGADPIIDSVIYNDPKIPVATALKVFPERLIPLWLQALDRPEKSLQCQAATTIVQAHERGMPGLDKTILSLVRVLDRPEQDVAVRLAAARALIALNAKQSAPRLFEHAQKDGIDMRNLVEPALAKWSYEPAKLVWLERIAQRGMPRNGYLVAIDCLGIIREEKAAPRLRELALSKEIDSLVRLEAAKALGGIKPAGLEKVAHQLIWEKGPTASVAQLAAATLLVKDHGSHATQEILLKLAAEAEPVAATVALDALLEENANLVLPLLAKLVASPDAKIRMKAIEAVLKAPLPADISLIAQLLDDPHPHVRVRARQVLADIGTKGAFADTVRIAGMKVLLADAWRGQEQASLLLGLLDHKPAALRMVELLQSQRPKAFAAVAWGLRKLAVPATHAAQLDALQKRWEKIVKADGVDDDIEDLGMSQLVQSLALAKHSPALPFFDRLVSRPSVTRTICPETRAAAIWGLGRARANGATTEFVGALIGRLNDAGGGPVLPEDGRVRLMSAVALGQTKAKSSEDSLRKFYVGKLGLYPISNACGWALEQVTGEPFPKSGNIEFVQRGWFLEPVD
jgi:HEAT repeat protein